MGNGVDPRIRELRKLRERRGMVAGRTKVCETLMADLGLDPTNRDEASGELHERIVRTLKSMGRHPHVLALRNAYGLDLEDPGLLGQRREVFGAAQNPPIVPETVETWENRAIQELLANLLAPISQRPTTIALTFILNSRVLEDATYQEYFADGGTKGAKLGFREGARDFTYQAPPTQLNELVLMVFFKNFIPSEIWIDQASSLNALEDCEPLTIRPHADDSSQFPNSVARRLHPEPGEYVRLRW